MCVYQQFFLVSFGVKQMDNNCQCYIPFKQQKAATTIFANPFTEITQPVQYTLLFADFQTLLYLKVYRFFLTPKHTEKIRGQF